jgi:hypothetical protein
MAINFLSDIDLKGNKLVSAAINPLASAPASATEGELYYNTGDDKLYSYDGSAWNEVGSTNTNTTYALTGASNKITLTGSDSSVDDVALAVDAGTNATLLASSNTVTFTLQGATNAKLGGVELYQAGSSASLTPVTQSVPSSGNDRLYQVMMDKDKKVFVHIPWTDNNTEYTAGDGLTLTGTAFSLDSATATGLGGIKLGSATALTATYETGTAGGAGRTYPVQVNASGLAAVSVPWTDSSSTTVGVKTDGATSVSIANGSLEFLSSSAGGIDMVQGGGTGAVTLTAKMDIDNLTATTVDVAGDDKIAIYDISQSKLLSATPGDMPLSIFGTPDANIAMNAKKITGLADGALAQDAVTVNQLNTAVTGLLDFKGGLNASNGQNAAGESITVPEFDCKKGDMYVVTTAGTLLGNVLEVGDSVYFVNDVDENDGTTASDLAFANNQLDVATAAATAAAATIGISSYDSADFDVTAGFVELKDRSITAGTYGDNYSVSGTPAGRQSVEIAMSATGVATAISESAITWVGLGVKSSADLQFTHGLNTSDYHAQLYYIKGGANYPVMAELNTASANRIDAKFGIDSQAVANDYELRVSVIL